MSADMVRCRQPHPHPYMSPYEPQDAEPALGVVGSADSPKTPGDGL